jgi:uncharacterized FAD-dependent dehydrogenase
MDVDVVIIGAGLAGIIAAIRLRQLGHSLILTDSSLPDAHGEIGGFAKFSGAKFSLPPAGMGLVDIAKTEDNLWKAIENVSDILGLDFNSVEKSSDNSTETPLLREYTSLILTPHEIDELIARLREVLTKLDVRLIKGHCSNITSQNSINFVTIDTGMTTINHRCKAVFYAGGRLGTKSLNKAGITPTDTKGIDVGMRIEFFDNAGLAGLRQYGPDAKFIKDGCRTFCLNVPGEIYRYPFGNITIPGGVVANELSTSSNVGILYRTPQKNSILSTIETIGKTLDKETLENGFRIKGEAIGEAKNLLEEMYGKEATAKLNSFCDYLGEKKLVNWDLEHQIHLPLIDWHWSTFSQPGTFRTENNSIFCLGDSSGHARGLLQAAVSGWLAAEEYSYGN